jgi:hypothetical protein
MILLLALLLAGCTPAARGQPLSCAKYIADGEPHPPSVAATAVSDDAQLLDALKNASVLSIVLTNDVVLGEPWGEALRRAAP